MYTGYFSLTKKMYIFHGASDTKHHVAPTSGRLDEKVDANAGDEEHVLVLPQPKVARASVPLVRALVKTDAGIPVYPGDKPSSPRPGTPRAQDQWQRGRGCPETTSRR